MTSIWGNQKVTWKKLVCKYSIHGASGTGYLPENERMSAEKEQVQKEKQSSNQHFSGDMFVFGGVR